MIYLKLNNPIFIATHVKNARLTLVAVKHQTLLWNFKYFHPLPSILTITHILSLLCLGATIVPGLVFALKLIPASHAYDQLSFGS